MLWPFAESPRAGSAAAASWIEPAQIPRLKNAKARFIRFSPFAEVQAHEGSLVASQQAEGCHNAIS
jgi:hypothetical protein